MVPPFFVFRSPVLLLQAKWFLQKLSRQWIRWFRNSLERPFPQFLAERHIVGKVVSRNESIKAGPNRPRPKIA